MVYRLFFVCSLAALLVLGSQQAARAGCCLSGSRTYTDFSGVMLLDTGGTQCAWHFDHCTVTVYGYEACEEGPSSVVSFRVHPGAGCDFYPIMCLAYMSDCGYVATSEGNAFECNMACPY